MEQGKMKESLKVASEITNAREKSLAYREISKLLMDQGQKEESLRVASDINFGSERIEAFKDFGKGMNYKDASLLLKEIDLEENCLAFITGMSYRIQDSLDSTVNINPYLYHHSDNTVNLSNILFYKAKMACFFEKERNEEKLDMLSEVLDIKDWRRISAV